MELQQIQLDERELHQKYLTGFEKLKTNLGILRSSFNFLNPRPFEIAFRIFFREEHQTFREKIALLRVLEELDKLIDEKALKYEELRIKESELQQQESSITEGATIEACLSTEGATLEACLVNEGITLNDNTGVTESNRIESTNSSSETLFRSSADENKSFDKESSSLEGNDADVDIGSLNDSKYTTWDKTFAKENEKYDEYDQPLLKRKNELEKKNQEFLKQINDLDNKLQKARQTDQTLRMLLPKDDNVQTGKHGLGFEKQNDNVNPSVLNKAKELTPCLYNFNEMGKDELSDHKIISEEELKCEAEKRLKVKQRKSLLSYLGFVYVETQPEEPPKVPLKRRNVNLKEHLEKVQLRNYDPKL
ncbi:hypothetical protein Tco_1210518 [Tanacetum coccineum]